MNNGRNKLLDSLKFAFLQISSRSVHSKMAEYPPLFMFLLNTNSLNFLWSPESRRYIPFVVLEYLQRNGLWFPDHNLIICDEQVFTLTQRAVCDIQWLFQKINSLLDDLIIWQERLFVLRRILVQNRNAFYVAHMLRNIYLKQ